jgi:nicotinamide mononucleotide adenylyltransferase
MKKLIFTYLPIISLILALGTAAAAQAKKAKPKPKTLVSTSSLSDDEIVFGLKDALSNGVTRAGSALSRKGGFYDDPQVKLSMPLALQELEKKLRALKYDDLVDDFMVSMNRAAEQSVVESTFPINDAIRQMTIQDPKKVLAGAKNAATQYFQAKDFAALAAKVQPLVATATTENGVIAQLKVLREKGGVTKSAFNIDEYVTQKTLEAMFQIIAAEEKRIREDPSARTTAILQKIFGNSK